eukprot:1000987-Rhodomonas_salina.1
MGGGRGRGRDTVPSCLPPAPPAEICWLCFASGAQHFLHLLSQHTADKKRCISFRIERGVFAGKTAQVACPVGCSSWPVRGTSVALILDTHASNTITERWGKRTRKQRKQEKQREQGGVGLRGNQRPGSREQAVCSEYLAFNMRLAVLPH